MNKNNFLPYLAAVVLGGGLLFFLGNGTGRTSISSETPPSNQLNASTLSASESMFDFGTVSMSAGKVTHAFKIKNTSTTPVTITKIQTSCMCTVASLVTTTSRKGPFGMPGHVAIPKINEIIAPNQEAIIEAVFDPAAHGPAGVGKIRRIVYVEMNGNESNPLELSFEATVTP